MILQKVIILAAVLSTLLPVAAILFRGRSRHMMTLATLLSSAALSFYLIVLLRLVEMGPQASAGPWIYALIASALPVLLAGYLLSLGIGRDKPEEYFRRSRRTFVLLGLLGVLLLCMLRQKSFITGYDWMGRRGTIYLGSLGKAYLIYLLVGVVAIGYNLEKTYRTAPVDSRYRIRLPILGFFSLLGFLTFVLSVGLLYSTIGTGKLVASALPITLASVAVAYGFLRGAIVDVAAPVSRNVVYSSFTAMSAALFLVAIGVAAQIATWTHWSPDEILIVASVFLAVLVAALLLFSNQFQRSVRRYIDRNFYVNRYDYRSQWSNLMRSLEQASDREGVLDRISPYLLEAFGAEEITISLMDEATRGIRPVRGKGACGHPEILEPGSPLFARFTDEGKTLLLDRNPHDFAYIPIYAENDKWLDATASHMVAPLLVKGDLVGTIGLERHDQHDPFTFEDVALLDSIVTHVAASLRSIQLAVDLAETREIELMSQWSSMLLHDLKNYLAPLRIVATNLVEYRANPDVVVACAQDIGNVTDRMGRLVHMFSELRTNPRLGNDTVSPNDIARETLQEMQISRRPSIQLEACLESQQAVAGDRNMLRRVLENLISNALDAMNGSGRLSITTRDFRTNDGSWVHIEVTDSGGGIPEEFIREKLFRPFASTKKDGLGLGLYQCRAIVQAHGGDLSVRSEVGKGSTFRIALRGAKSRMQLTQPLELHGRQAGS